MEGQQTPGSGAPPPPGWYPDPQMPGAQRWWDGARWSEQVHPPQGAVPPVVAPPRDPEADARQWAMFAHLSALLASLIGLSFLGPMVIYLTKKDDHPFVADQAREALNFNLSVLIYGVSLGIVGLVLTIVLIGFLLWLLFIPLGIAWIVLTIVAGVKANAGEPYRYPLTIRMVS